MNAQPKLWWKSRGTIGALVAIIAAGISAVWNVELEEENLTDFILQLATIIAAIIALIGRVRAKHPITFRKPPVVMVLNSTEQGAQSKSDSGSQLHAPSSQLPPV